MEMAAQVSSEAGKKVKENEREYEKAFLSYLINFIKEDEVLKDFYVRLIYECEIIKMVVNNRKQTELWELGELINEMKAAKTIEEIAEKDAFFHRRLFSIAGEEEFYKWYQLQAKTLNSFLNGFWSYIGYGTDYYNKLMEIHTNIYNAISKVIDVTDSAISDEYQRILTDLSYNISLYQAFKRFYERTKIEEIKIIYNLLNVEQEDLKSVFSLIRNEFKYMDKVNTNKLHIDVILNVLNLIFIFTPIILVLIITLIDINYFNNVFVTPIGSILIEVIILLYFVLLFFIYKIIRGDKK